MHQLDLNKMPRCNANWNAMRTTNTNRMCELCNRCVIDFTNKNDREVIRIHNEASAPVCGHYRPDQYRLLTNERKGIHNVWLVGALSIMGLSALAQQAETRINPNAYIIEAQRFSLTRSDTVTSYWKVGIKYPTGAGIDRARIQLVLNGDTLHEEQTNAAGYTSFNISNEDSTRSVGEVIVNLPWGQHFSRKVIAIKPGEPQIQVLPKRNVKTISYGVTIEEPKPAQQLKYKWQQFWHGYLGF